MLRPTIILLFLQLLASCDPEIKPDPKKQIISIVMRNEEFDLSPYPFTIISDSTEGHGRLFDNSYTRECQLHFDSVTFDALKKAIRSTAYFNKIDILDDSFSQKVWSNNAPLAKRGTWGVTDNRYHFQIRYDGRGIKADDEFLMSFIDTTTAIWEITYMDYRGNL